MEILTSRILLKPLDPTRTIDFYENTVGLSIYREFGGEAFRGVVFFLGGGFLEISGSGEASPNDATQIWLQVRDIADAHRRLCDAGVQIEEPPSQKPWGLLEMRVRDPDGRLLIFVEVPADHPLRRDLRG